MATPEIEAKAHQLLAMAELFEEDPLIVIKYDLEAEEWEVSVATSATYAASLEEALVDLHALFEKKVGELKGQIESVMDAMKPHPAPSEGDEVAKAD